MKKILGMFMAVVFCSVLLGAVNLYAEETAGSTLTGLKEELAADKQKVAEQKGAIKTDAQTAKSEEKDLKAQIKAAELAGDKQKAKELRTKLKTLHQENVKQKQEDKKALKAAKVEVRKDKKELHKELKAKKQQA